MGGLPAGNWTINPGGVTGNTVTTTITGLAASTTYNYTVTNAAGCTSPASANVVINAQPVTPSAPTVGAITQPTCATATGSVVLGGLPAGNWTINPGGVTGNTVTTTITGLAASTTYNYTVTNAAGCTSPASANVVINAQPVTPSAPTVGAITQPTCATATGSVVLGGLPAGNWTINPGGVTGNTVTTTITGLAASTTYNYTVTNAAGCTSPASANVVINAQPVTPSAPTVGAITQPTCATATGSVVLGGLPAGNWTINPGGVTGNTVTTTITGLAASTTYNYTVTNAAGCTSPASANVVINAQPVTPSAPTVGAITQPTCATATGSVVLGGLPAGNWTINPGGVTGNTVTTTITGLAASTTYNYTVTNAAGCTSPASANVVINAQPVTPSAPTVGAITQPTCATATGSVVLGGLPAGNWTINPGGVTGNTVTTTITGLAASTTYNYTVTNAAGCTSPASANVVINAQPVTPSAPTVGAITQPTCATATGSVVLGGLPAGNWTINPGGVTGNTVTTTITGLAASTTYNYTVTNAAGCTSPASANVVINAQPVTPSAPTVGAITQPTCATATGSVVLGGLPAGNWTINPGGVTGNTVTTTITGLAASTTYNYTVTNAAGCTSPASANVVINAQPVTPSAPTVGAITQPTCATATGSFTITNYNAAYTYAATPSLGVVIAGSSVTAPAGSYTLVANLGTCTSTASVSVTVNAQPATPVAPTLGAVTQPTCAVATGSFTITNYNAAYTYAASPSLGVVIAGSSVTAPAGSYTLTATLGACSSLASVSVTVNAQPTTPTAPVTAVTQPTCALTTGTITVTVQNAGETYSLDNGVSFQPSNIKAGLAAGSYNVIIQSAGGCNSVATLTTVNVPPAPPSVPTVASTIQPTCGTPTGTIDFAVQAGVEYSVGAGYQAGTTFAGLASGTYTLTVRSIADNTCITAAASTVTINVPPAPPSVPTVASTIQPTCGTPTGTIDFAVQAGVEYSVGAGYQAGTTFAGLVSGTYTLTVRSIADNTCITAAASTVTINVPPAPPSVPTVASTIQPTCGTPTGTIDFAVQAGVEYSVGAGYQAGTTFAGLASGTYTLTVRSIADNTCITAAASTVTINVPPAPPSAPTVASTIQPTCGTPTGTIDFAVQAGVEYSVGAGYQAGTTFAGLVSGTYTLTVRSIADNTCITSAASTVTINVPPAPPSVPTVASTIQPTCGTPTGTIDFAVQAGVEYSVGAGYQAGTTFAGLASGTYTLTVRSIADNTCITAAASTVTINVPPAPPSVPTVASTIQPTCGTPTGTIDFAVQAGVEYSVGAGYQAGTTFAGLVSGTYTLTVRSIADNTCITAAASTVTINVPPAPPSVPTVASTIQPTCGTPTGTIDFAVQAGVEYSVGAGYQAGTTFAGLASGTYTLTVRSIADNTCITAAASTVTINVPPAPPSVPTVASTIQPTCGTPTGTIDFAVQAGVEYSVGAGYQAGTTFAGLVSGTYTLTVRSIADNTCITSAASTVTINVPPAPPSVPTVASTIQPTCGTPTGTIDFAVQAGVEYSVGAGYQAGTTFAGLASGTYTLTVRSIADNTCITAAASTVTINVPPAPPSAPTVASTIQPTCGTPTGTIDFAVQAGVEYSVGAGYQAGTTFAGLVSGTYTLTVRSIADNTCITSAASTVTINVPPAVPSVIITNPATVCSPSTVDLTAAAITTGSTVGLTFTYWTDIAASSPYATPTAATSGTYYIKGSDGSGCFDIQSVTVNVNPSLTVTTTQVDIACFSGTTGTVTAIPSGGSGTYSYSWNTVPVQTTVTATGLTAGTYTVTVSDGTSCSAVISATLTEPTLALSGTIFSQTNVSVYNGTDGSVTVAGSGGTAPYQYKLGAGSYQLSGTFGTLTAGVYIVTVQDLNLCTSNVSITITQPAPPVSGSITSTTNVKCFGTSTGSITVVGSGGVTPYDYKLDAGSYQSSGTFGSLATGTYTITVRDAALNTFDITATITQPASVLGGFINSQTNVLCNGNNTGSVTIAGSGGVGPYLYKLGAGSYQASGTFGTLTATTYIITVQDANLCTFNVTATITQPLVALTGNITTQTNVSCFGSTNGSVTIAGNGGIAPYEYSLNGGTYQVSGIFNNLTAGTYTISVRDANFCTTNIPVTITTPSVLDITQTVNNASCPGEPDGSITLTITGGTQPYNVNWLDGIITQNRQNIPDGTYRVAVTDLNSCAASLNIEVAVIGSESCIEISQIITPNTDGHNDTWKIKNIELFPDAEVFVFTRWGKLVFRTKNISANEWNGTYEGRLLPTDSYHYVLHLNNGSEPRSGVISIIR